MRKRRVLVFGVFDLFHPGHLVFFRQARHYGSELIAVVARDETTLRMKGRMPKEGEGRRLKKVRALPMVSRAVLGDRSMGSYKVVRRYQPDVICLGYDQEDLSRDLRARMRRREIPRARIVRLLPYQPHRFKSSKFTPLLPGYPSLESRQK